MLGYNTQLKCISLKQPYAYLLASGVKSIEIRKWNTNFRGEFLIHASKSVNTDALSVYPVEATDLVSGAIIGKAYLYGVKKYGNRDDFIHDFNKHFSVDKTNHESSFKRYGFLIHNSMLFEKSIPYPGKLGFFDVNPGLLNNNSLKESIWYFDL